MTINWHEWPVRYGTEGPQAEEVQRRLNCWRESVSLPPIKVDGEAYGATNEQVRNFQRFAGLDDDGTVGPDTWAKLDDWQCGQISEPGDTGDATSGSDVVLDIALINDSDGLRTDREIQRFADASNEFSDRVLSRLYRPTRADIFTMDTFDPDTHRAHLLLSPDRFADWSVGGAAAFHTEWIAPGDDDPDALMVTNVGPDNWTSPGQHEHNETAGNPGVDKVFLHGPDRARFGENSDWLQGYPCELRGVALEHVVTERYLRSDYGENPASYDSAYLLGQPPAVTSPDDVFSWGMWLNFTTGQIEYVTGTGFAAASIPAHAAYRVAVCKKKRAVNPTVFDIYTAKEMS